MVQLIGVARMKVSGSKVGNGKRSMSGDDSRVGFWWFRRGLVALTVVEALEVVSKVGNGGSC